MILKRFRLFTQAVARSSALQLLCASSLLVGCAAQSPPETGGFAMQISALTGTCGSASTTSPLSDIRSFTLVVRGPDFTPDKNGNVPAADKAPAGQWSFDSAFNGSSKSITFAGIQAGSPREVTLLGKTQDGTASWFARKSALTINKNETLVVDVTLMAAEGFTCVGPDAGIYKLAFPVATRIASDKILITGGFSDYAADGPDFKLTGAVSQAWLFDPAKGTFTDAGQLTAARGGHSAIYLPKSSKILIFGGTTKMSVKGDGSAPPAWNPADAVNPRWELCSLDTNNRLKCSTDATIQDNVKPRVMPNLMLLTADYVVASGGAPWPTTDAQDFRYADLFDPTLATQVEGGKGGFVKLKPGALAMNGSRAGSAVVPFVTPTTTGALRYLVWGGNEEIATSGTVPSAPGKVVEFFLESSNLGDGRFDDTYALLGPDGKPAPDDTSTNGSLFFPTLSALGPATLDSGDKIERFAAIGGTRWKDNGKGGVWAKPSADDAYLLTVNDTQKTITIQKMPGMTTGVYLHTATATGGHVVVGGGLTGLKGGGATLFDFAPNPDDLLGVLVPSDPVPPAAATFIARGAIASQKLSNDCILMFGGVADFSDLTSHDGGASDVYCPGFLAQ